MFNGESKKRPTVSLRGKSKEEDRTEFIRRARSQREGRARGRLHVSCATTIQRVWRGRACVGKWREEEREAWDKKMSDVGRVQTMFAAAGKAFQVPTLVLQTLLSQLVNFHTFPRDAGRFSAALGLMLAAISDPSADAREQCGGKAAAPRSTEHVTWTLLAARLGLLCLHYMSEVGRLAGVDGKGNSRTDTMDDSGGGAREMSAAAESAVEAFALISSPREWGRRGWLESTEVAEGLCRRLLVSLALGRLVLRGEGGSRAEGAPTADDSGARKAKLGGGRSVVRLAIRTDVDGGSGCWTRTPRLFRVLRVLWDATAGGGTRDTAGSAVRLLCSCSLEAIGISAGGRGAVEVVPAMGEASAPPMPTPLAARATPLEGVGQSCKLPALVGNRVLLDSFASAMLSAPKLLEHPLRALLMDPMLAGDAGAWWMLVSVAGDAVGASKERRVTGGGSGGGAARRQDVAWTVANVLKVYTGAGGAASGTGAEHARCLVRALCRLLRQVSLHTLLQGAGQTAKADTRSSGSAGGLQIDATELDDDDMDIDDIFSSGLGSGGGVGSGGPPEGATTINGEVTGGGIRLEAIVRHHRRRCAMRATLSHPPERQPSTGTVGLKRPGVSEAGVGGDSASNAPTLGSRSTVNGEGKEQTEAMVAAVGRLADPAFVGKLFDSILPPAEKSLSAQDGGEQHRRPDSGLPLSSFGSRTMVRGGASSYGAEEGDDDPVLALCTLYADLVMDGVASSAGAVGSAAGGAGGGISAGSRTAPGKSVLNALAFGRPRAPIAAKLWAYLQRSHNLDLYAEGARAKKGAGMGAAAEGGRMRSALFLFCSAFSHQLMALDDEEFYEKQKPLTLAEVRQLVAFLKKWLCRLYWLDPAIPRLLEDNLPLEPAAALRQCEDNLREALLLLSATRLFNQLHERNTRRNFLDAEEWYWKAISERELSPPNQGDPRLELFTKGNLGAVLTNIPQVIPFFQRVGIFRQLIETERGEYQSSGSFVQNTVRIRISRDNLYEDSAARLTKMGSALKGRVQVTFMNEHGVEEAGIDGGGVFKEYMDLLTKRAFDPQYALFLATEDQYLFPNPAAELVVADPLFHFDFLGRVLAKAVFEDILVEPQFSPVFLNKLLRRQNYIDDLYSLDPELYRNLMQLKTIVQEGGDVEELCLTFSGTTAMFGESKVWDLIPGGRDVPVTNSSVISYIHLMAHFKLNVQTARPCEAFLKGFSDLIPAGLIRMFNPHELQRLIGGEGGRAVDVDDLKRNTRYAGGYHESQPVMGWFWDAIRSFSPEEQGQFLKFVTSCSRPPLLGFERLNPPICVQKVPDGEAGRLPSSATCMNLLKLPQYSDGNTLREKLLYAISAKAGFELT